MLFWQLRLPRSRDIGEIERVANDATTIQLPRPEMFVACAMHILAEQMGFRRSAELGRGRFADGKPAPMLSYSLIEYVMGLDLSDFDVLEVGGGDSTEFWAQRVRSVTVLEQDPSWAEHIRQRTPAVTVEVAEADALADRIAGLERQFSLIVIDPAANRARCARVALTKLAAGGLILLDNSDWYPNTSQILREAGLIQVDFHDFRPCHHFRATSSLFLTRDFAPKPLGQRLPQPPIGGKLIQSRQWDAE